MTRTDIAPWLAESRWPIAPIRLAARLGTGHTPSRNMPEYWEDCTIPWVTLADVWQLRSGTVSIISDTKEKISALGLANSAAVKHTAGTVILSRTASVGFSAILGASMATSQDFATWTCGPRLYPRFLLYALRGMAPDLKRVATGSTHKTIYMPDIEQLQVPLPPLDDQRRIADFLDAETVRIDEISAARRAQDQGLADLWNSRLAFIINDLISVHGLIALRRVVTSVEQGWSPQCEEVIADPEEWAVLKTSSVSTGEFSPLEHKRLPDGIAPKPRYQVHDGDILLTRGSGSPDHVGVAAEVHTDGRRLLLSDLLYRIRLADGWSPGFVTLALGSQPIRGFMGLLFRGQSGQTIKLRAEDVRSIEIPAVPEKLQAKISGDLMAERVAIREAGQHIKSSMSLLAERRQALITAAVTGQFDVSTARGADLS